MDDRRMRFDRAAALHEEGAFDRAATLYEQLLADDPHDAAVLCHLGALELDRSRPQESVGLLERAAAMISDRPEVHNQLGMAYKALSRWGDASRAFERALRIDSGFAAAYFHLGEMAQSLGQWDSAVALYRQSIGLAPEVLEPHLALGNLLLNHGNWAGVEQCFRAALEMKGRLDATRRLEVQSQLGVALLRQEKLDEAESLFLEMLSVAPDLAEMHSNLAFLYERQGKLDRAVASGRKAVELNPGLPDGHNNLGVALRSSHRLDEAEASFARAAALNPEFLLARFNQASVQLLRENYTEGWKGYEHRQALINSPPRQFGVPRWTGERLQAGVLLLHAEQGYGDTIQFIRFARQAAQRSGSRVVVEVPPALVSLIGRVDGIDACLPFGSPHSGIAAHLPLPSLPGVLGIGRDQLCPSGRYLKANEDRVRVWTDLVGRAFQPDSVAQGPSVGGHDPVAPANPLRSRAESPTYRIGLAWQGNPAQSQDVVRSCPLRTFAPLRDLPGVQWFSLQKDLPAGFEDDSGLGLVPIGHLFNDFDDTAAAMASLDLVITVDTSVAHLAGALGRPTWTLLCHTPDWRWQLDRADCPWYPSMRLFRQPRWGDWDAVMEQVAEALTGSLKSQI